MLKSLMRQQQNAEDEGIFVNRRLRDLEARMAELFDENKLLKANKERALRRVEMLEAERGRPHADSIEYMALAEEKAKLAEELRLEKSLRAKS